MLNRLSRISDKLAWTMFCILMADVCIFGAGKLISVGPLSFRIILLALTTVVCLPLMISKITTLFKSKYTWFVGAFLLWLILSTVIGIYNHNRLSLIITDWKGFLYFAVFPSAICLVSSRQRAHFLSKVMMYSAGIMALIHIAAILCYLLLPELMKDIDSYAKSIHFFYISYDITETNVRISFLSLACQLFGCAFSVYYQIKETTPWKRRLYAAVTALCLFGIWLSYTRSIYFAAGIAAIGTLAVLLFRADKAVRKRIAAHLCSSLVLFSVLIGGFHIGTGTNYFFYGLTRSLVGVEFNLPFGGDGSSETTEASSPTDETDPEKDNFLNSTLASDSLRHTTISELMELIKSSPVWGHGLGAEIPSRPDGLNEYFFLDLMAKTGLIGFCLYLAPLALMLLRLLQKFRNRDEDFALYGLWFAVILGFVCYSFFTPCMNSSVGIMCYCCAMAVFQQASSQKNDIQETTI